MNILIAADYATPSSGNFIASCIELGRKLHGRGDTLVFIVPEHDNTLSESSWVHWLEQEGIPVYLVNKDETSEEAQLQCLQEIMLKHKIDILHIHFGMFHHLVIHHRNELPVKIIVHDHMDFAAGPAIQQIRQRVRAVMISAVYRMKKITVASVNPDKDKYYCLARHRFIPNRLSMIRNVPASLTREECRKSLGFSEKDHVCLLLGWDMQRKGLDIAVNAVADLRKLDPNAILAIVGMGSPASQKAIDFIKERTEISPESSWIRFLPSTEDMFAYHRAIDAYLSASRSEAFSYGILETISQNTPVAVSDIKGTSWCWKYSKVFKYPVEDAHACSLALKKALDVGRASSNFREILNEYSIDQWCDEIIDTYQSL